MESTASAASELTHPRMSLLALNGSATYANQRPSSKTGGSVAWHILRDGAFAPPQSVRMFRSRPQVLRLLVWRSPSAEFSAESATEWRRASPIPQIAEAGLPRCLADATRRRGAL